jgi:uncharacterized membrane protein YsdA (DUF1294 family)
MNIVIIAGIILGVWNLITFGLYGLDKLKAGTKQWRISERTLILVAVLMGALGAFLGMQVFRHKTKHAKFVIGVPLCLILNIAVVFALFHFGILAL